MNTLTVNKRIFTVAGRNNVAIITDSKIPEGSSSGRVTKFEGTTTQIACLKALKYELENMPKNVRLDFKVAFLLPETISFLSYEDTRNYWIANGCKKNGEPIEAELYNEISEIHCLLREQKHNIQLFRQKTLTSKLYNSYKVATWNCLRAYAPEVNAEGNTVETVSCNY